MIALTRGIGDSLLSLTAKVGGNIPTPAFEPETLAFESRVLSDGGKILDIEKLDRFIKANKSLGLYANLQFAVSKQFGYKLDGSGNIIKIYDASKNGNDLNISRGTVPENLENEMFFLNNVFFKDETVTFDTIGDKFTFVTDINHPNPDLKPRNNIASFMGLDFWAGGTFTSGNRTLAYQVLSQALFYSSENAFENTTDGSIDRQLIYRHSKNVSQNILKDGQNMGQSQNTFNSYSVQNPQSKIVFGGRVDELINLDADCYLNDSFFYNEYLTDQELEDINDTL